MFMRSYLQAQVLNYKEYNKLTDVAKEKIILFTPDNSEEVHYFSPKETARKYIIKHLGEAVEIKDLFSERVFEPLEDKFDEIIKKDFEFGSQELEDEIGHILDSSEESEED